MPMMTSTLALLKEATAADHRAVEDELPLLRPDVTLSDYRHYLTGMWSLHAPVERALGLPGLRAVLPDVDQRRRLPLLERDLGALGLSRHDLASLPAAAPLSPPRRVPEILGALYVLEGSTLGGQILRRHLAETLGGAIAGALGYLSAYPHVGAMWKKFREAVDLYGAEHPEDRNEMIAAAQHLFRSLRSWLAQPELQTL